jgi:hypothetical protein
MATYFALVLTIVLPMFVLAAVVVATVAGIIDWIFAAITAVLVVVSMLALIGNWLLLDALFVPYIFITVIALTIY